MEASRYKILLNEVHVRKPQIIMEIGVFKADNAKRMLVAAKQHNTNVKYYGFDLFEDATEEELLDEVSMQPITISDTYEKLSGTGASIYLYKGKSVDTLLTFIKRNIIPDFVFIDGGHSKETIESDWHFVKQVMGPNTWVYFDDYLISKSKFDWGCNDLVERLALGNEYGVGITETRCRRYMLRHRGSKIGTDMGEIRIVKVWKKNGM